MSKVLTTVLLLMNNQPISDGNSTSQRPFTNCPSSPAQGRSLREFEEQMAGLHKENFNLKLRIYFLEEKSSTTGDSNDFIHKRNIDLKVIEHFTVCLFWWPDSDSIIFHPDQIPTQNKVENESLRKDLQEKQELLCQASKAMELMENQHKKQSNDAQMIIDDLNHKIEAMSVSCFNVNRFSTTRNLTFNFSTKSKAWKGL